MESKTFRYIKLLSLFAVLGFATQSCTKSDDFLDSKSTNDLNKESVFSDSLRTVEFMSGIYARLEFDIHPGKEVNSTGAVLSETTDEAETRWPGAQNVPNQIFGGTFSTGFTSKLTSEWSYLYTGIRQVNILLENVDKSPLPNEIKQRYKYEARMLRAVFYHNLLRYWGGIQLVGDAVVKLDAINDKGRSTFEECVEYIVSELDEIAPNLPIAYSGNDYGRVTKGAAMALKARVLLYAASPLFNGGSLSNDPAVIPLTAYPTANSARWERALQAAKDVMDLNVYNLYVDNNTRPGNGFYQVFLNRVNPEYILAAMQGNNKTVEAAVNPPSRGGSYLRYPSQQLVDAFPMKNGKAIASNNSGYSETKPYENRDPRFYFTIIYNGSLYFDTRTNKFDPIYTYEGAALDGIKAASVNTGTNTGYYSRKMANEMISASSSANTQRTLPIIRYAEILLNYAEAANELGRTEDALKQIIALRLRAGIEAGTDNRYGVPQNLSQQETRELIKNERFIELAFEEHRYWDIRRWKLGDKYDRQYIQGMKITRNATTGAYTYNRINVRSPRYFKANSYLFPIPISEIQINPLLLQNPGW